MLRMAVGHGNDLEAEEALTEALDRCAAQLDGLEPRGALLFCTFEADATPLVAEVRRRFPGVRLAGSTSSAELSSILGFQEGSVAVAMFASDSIEVTTGLGTGLSEDPEGAVRAAVAEALAGVTGEPRLCVTMPAANPDPRRVIAALGAELGPDVVLFGGISSATFQDPGVATQIGDDRVVRDGLSLMLFSGPLAFSIGVAAGWHPVGKPATVTSATGTGVVQEIDGQPALRFYERYLGEGAGPALATPLAVFEAGAEDFYLRAAARHDQSSGSIVIFGGPPEDATVQLAVAMTEEIVGGSRTAAARAVEAFPADATPEAALIFSCMTRKVILGTRVGSEIVAAREALGEDMPLCGFYSYGEIAPIDTGTTHYHNETVVAALLGST